MLFNSKADTFYIPPVSLSIVSGHRLKLFFVSPESLFLYQLVQLFLQLIALLVLLLLSFLFGLL